MCKTYKYQLRKSSRKEVCPACGQKRFVPYVLSADGVTMAGAEYGRCDREQNCGYHRYPNSEKIDMQQVVVEPKEPLRYIGSPITFSISNTIALYAISLFGDAAIDAFNRYDIGSINDTNVIWWQRDIDGKIRTGKIMTYKADGHRDKAVKFPVTWAHKHTQLKHLFRGEELRQCLFGESLLKSMPNAKVAVVESEKTAMLMSIIYPNTVWVATGGSQGIKSERMRILIGRDVVLYPDNGKYWEWLRIAEQYGWECSDKCERDSIFDGCDVWDIAEFNLKKIKEK